MATGDGHDETAPAREDDTAILSGAAAPPAANDP
jgi:hypothetical protein